jgi:hypothetical protein
MSLLLLFSGSEAPPAGDPQQHLLLALQWTPDVTPPVGEPKQHLLLALQWVPGDVVVPPVEPPTPDLTGPTGSGGGGFYGPSYYRDRPDEPTAREILQLRADDEILLAVLMAFVECDEWEP